METFEFQDSLLELAKDIPLAQLIDTPFTQAFVVSMIANAVNNAHNYQLEGDADAILEVKLRRLLNSIPHDERLVLYRQCGDLISKRKSYTSSRREQVTN